MYFSLKIILQTIDKEARQIFSNVTRKVEKTIEKIPIINVVKRLLDRFTPLQVKICLFFSYPKWNLVESSAIFLISSPLPLQKMFMLE